MQVSASYTTLRRTGRREAKKIDVSERQDTVLIVSRQIQNLDQRVEIEPVVDAAEGGHDLRLDASAEICEAPVEPAGIKAARCTKARTRRRAGTTLQRLLQLGRATCECDLLVARR